MIESSSVSLSYIQKHKKEVLLNKMKNKLQNQQFEQFQDHLPAMFEFQLNDGFQTKVLLKNRHSVSQFLKWHSKQYGKQLTIDQLGDTKIDFGNINIDHLSKKSIGYQFLELEYQNLFILNFMKVKRRYQPTRWYDKCLQCCNKCWKDTGIAITQKGILQIDIKHQNNFTDFILFTTKFSIKYGINETGFEKAIEFCTVHRYVLLKVKTWQQFYTLVFFAQKGLQINRDKPFKFQGSSYLRKFNKLQFLVDAEDYYFKIAQDIEKAKNNIFMCSWWFSPQLPLIRPLNKENQKYRLDRLLLKKAQQGVSIYLLVYNNLPVVPNDATYAQQKMRTLHKNIYILLHPDNIIPGIWSHHQKIVIVDQNTAYVGGIDPCYGRYDTSRHPIDSNSKSMYPGIQYNNVRVKQFQNAQDYQKEDISRSTPRMPWHDTSVKLQGKSVVDICNHFLQYWDHAYLEATIIKKEVYGINEIVPSKKMDHKLQSEDRMVRPDHKKQYKQNRQKIDKAIHRYNRDKIRDPANFHNLVLSPQSLGLIKKRQTQWNKIKQQYSDRCQLIKSASQWSIGLENDEVEKSIHNAYIELINHSQHFIYIENQFFISARGSNDPDVENQIANAIYNRIQKAVKNNQAFKVVIFMPLLPGMQGQVNENIPLPLKLILYWQFQTLSQGQNSLLKRIQKITDNPQQYIQFYGLRQHGILEGKPVTQIIYIHSKLMIVDDRHVICGSANINDRSMLGDRDSEICLYYQDGEKISITFNGVEEQVNLKAHNFRVKLYCQNFAVSPEMCRDPLDRNLNENIMQKTAKSNTNIYRQLFGCYPDNRLKKLNQVQSFKKQPSLQQYNSESKGIIGHTVQFPLHFLEDEYLGIKAPYFIDDIMT